MPPPWLSHPPTLPSRCRNWCIKQHQCLIGSYKHGNQEARWVLTPSHSCSGVRGRQTKNPVPLPNPVWELLFGMHLQTLCTLLPACPAVWKAQHAYVQLWSRCCCGGTGAASHCQWLQSINDEFGAPILHLVLADVVIVPYVRYATQW